MTSKDRLQDLCQQALVDKGFANDVYKIRLRDEFMHVDVQGEYEYFLDLYDRKVRYPKNQHNLLIPYLLGIVDHFDIEQDSAHVFGEFPDIDIDYLPQIRDHLKNVWAIEEFGKENVCAIGNYTTFGIKSALIDMARVHDCDREEILSLTTQFGLKDDSGKALTWDSAMKLYPELEAYCKAHPDVADAAKRLLNRNRGMGMHAGGLIVANQSIDKLVPLVKGRDAQHVSAFVEGLHGTDLGPLGLIKFDLLVITDLLRIVLTCKLVKERYGLESISALPGQPDWSDTSYLNDPKALEMAGKGQLTGIFQFDSSGIRKLARDGGVTSFDDLCAYSALYRPGPLGMGMHTHYVERKNGRDAEWIKHLHPILKPILGKTYGVMVFQEQVMQILNAVGGIPLKDCEIVRKAISKKKVKEFGKYKEQFLEEGSRRTGWPIESVMVPSKGETPGMVPTNAPCMQGLWDQIESFAEYGFNKSHTVAYTYISSRLLYFKAHYPLEFYTVTLQIAGEDDKIKEYKRDAERHGIKIQKLDMNLSKENFCIVDNKVYVGFRNIKGIGEEVAKEIVSKQPYKSFEDFLARYGTDANVVKPLVCLGVFEDGSRDVLWEFYEHYKKETKRRIDRDKRQDKSQEKYAEELRFLLREWGCIDEDTSQPMEPQAVFDFIEKHSFTDDLELHKAITGAEGEEQIPGFDAFLAWKVYKKYKRSKDNFAVKKGEDKPISLKSFEPIGELEPEVKELLGKDVMDQESIFYGFSWQHPLELSSDFCHDEDRTFRQFEEDQSLSIALVEVMVSYEDINRKGKTKGAKKEFENPRKGQSKSKKEVWWMDLYVEDADFVQKRVRFWSDDYERFKDDLAKGNLLKLRVRRQAEYGNFTLDGPKKHLRLTLPPKEHDPRLQVMRKAEQTKTAVQCSDDTQAVLDEIRGMFS